MEIRDLQHPGEGDLIATGIDGFVLNERGTPSGKGGRGKAPLVSHILAYHARDYMVVSIS